MDKIEAFFRTVNYTDTVVNNENEYSISRELLKSVNEREELSVENLALKANISQASVSRIIRKIGFTSFAQFKEKFIASISDMKYNRKIGHMTRFKEEPKGKVFDCLYANALANLEATKTNLDFRKIDELIDMMKAADSITFYGTEHELAIFYTLQLDLLANNKPTYVYHNPDIRSFHARLMEENSLFISLQVSDKFLDVSAQRDLQKVYENRKAKMVVIEQDESTLDSIFDLVIPYGRAGSFNDGYYSLFLISQYISECLYK